MAKAERLDIIPARFHVIVTIRPKYACRRCDAGIGQAATPHWLIEVGLPAEGTLARVAVSGYADHLPLYRRCRICGRGGVDLDRSTSATWLAASRPVIRPRSSTGCWSTSSGPPACSCPLGRMPCMRLPGNR